jgi:Putative Flp pilus-assembly TadE/G-like
MLFVVGAMAVLAIDVTTFYTARSEAQIAADSAALAAARVLANSSMTSFNVAPTWVGTVQQSAQNVAYQVAQSNPVGGRSLVQANGEVTVSFPNCGSSTQSNPCVTVQVKRADLPTFFARIWGSTIVTVAATATAEAYNPSGLANGSTPSPVATTCVKPWLLPNIDPTTGNPIFDPATGVVKNSGMITGIATPVPLQAACSNCSGGSFPGSAEKWQFLPGETTTSFPAPSSGSVTCSPTVGGFSSTPYELAVAGCVQTPIACNSSSLSADLSDYGTRNRETAEAVNCLTHTEMNGGDTVDTTNNTPPPFEFLTGNDNPLVQAGVLASNTDVFVSDSIVTVPVFDSSQWPPNEPVQVIGFVQLFLAPAGGRTRAGGPSAGLVSTTVINMIGCGTGATGTPFVYGNGPSAVPVRLITPP